MFNPAGTDLELTGKLDEKTKTITWSGQITDETKAVMHWKFADAGGYTWDLAVTTNGKNVAELSGDRTKKKQ
jgi:hypothetical protein